MKLMSTKKEWLMAAIIPIIFAVGIGAFFGLFPPGSINLSNFIGYMASLSTVIMVLVYIFTTSRQLSAMRGQLTEMQYSRNVQVQPLLFLEKAKSNFELPRYYIGPKTKFKKMELLCRIHFINIVSNIGNGPAVAVDFIPKLRLGLRGAMDTATTLIETFGERIECISLKEGDSVEPHFMFQDEKHQVAEALLRHYQVVLNLVVVYKNALGMAFKQQIAFWINIPPTKELETLELCLKSIRTADIDFAEQVKKFESLMNYERDANAMIILNDVNAELKKRLGDKTEIDLSTEVVSGSFSVSPISQLEYEKILAEQEQIIKRFRKEDHME
jgi:hypothetical protein